MIGTRRPGFVIALALLALVSSGGIAAADGSAGPGDGTDMHRSQKGKHGAHARKKSAHRQHERYHQLGPRRGTLEGGYGCDLIRGVVEVDALSGAHRRIELLDVHGNRYPIAPAVSFARVQDHFEDRITFHYAPVRP